MKNPSPDPWGAALSVAPRSLRSARLQAHWAAQIPVALGQTLGPERPEYAHLSLAWDGRLRALVTQPTTDGVRAGLRVSSLSLVLIEGEELTCEQSLDHKDLEAGLHWLSEVVGQGPLQRPEHDLPDHPVAAGACFSLGAPDQAQPSGESVALEGWFEAASAELERLHASEDGASPVRLWPHHFDVATLITLDPGKHAEEARSIGVGLSPGDGSYDEPYFYVTPWPYPTKDELSKLTSGGWHTEGWVGAVLRASELVSSAQPQTTARTFLREAILGARTLLG